MDSQLFFLQSKQISGDQSVVNVFVVGGINTLEVCSSPYYLPSFIFHHVMMKFAASVVCTIFTNIP